MNHMNHKRPKIFGSCCEIIILFFNHQLSTMFEGLSPLSPPVFDFEESFSQPSMPPQIPPEPFNMEEIVKVALHNALECQASVLRQVSDRQMTLQDEHHKYEQLLQVKVVNLQRETVMINDGKELIASKQKLLEIRQKQLDVQQDMLKEKLQQLANDRKHFNEAAEKLSQEEIDFRVKKKLFKQQCSTVIDFSSNNRRFSTQLQSLDKLISRADVLRSEDGQSPSLPVLKRRYESDDEDEDDDSDKRLKFIGPTSLFDLPGPVLADELLRNIDADLKKAVLRQLRLLYNLVKPFHTVLKWNAVKCLLLDGLLSVHSKQLLEHKKNKTFDFVVFFEFPSICQTVISDALREIDPHGAGLYSKYKAKLLIN
jgi:hypothetical protein